MFLQGVDERITVKSFLNRVLIVFLISVHRMDIVDQLDLIKIFIG